MALFLLVGSLAAVTDPWRGDETYTSYITGLEFSSMFERIIMDVHPPLFYLLMWLWRNLWPEPHAMKIFNLIVGSMAILMVGISGRLAYGKRVGWIVALLWATFPQFIHFSQDARMYPLATLFEVACVLGLLIAPRCPRRGWMVFVFAMTGSLYTHNLCLVFASAIIIWEFYRCLIRRFRHRHTQDHNETGFTWIVSATFVIGLLYAPWIPFLFDQMKFPYLSATFDPPSFIPTVKKLFFFTYTLNHVPFSQPLAWIPGIFFLGLLPLIAFLSLFRYKDHAILGTGHAQTPRMMMWMATAPTVIVWVYSRFQTPIFDLARHGVLFIPFLFFPAAQILGLLAGKKWGKFLLPGLFPALSIWSFGIMRRPVDYDYTQPRDALLERAPLGVPILTYPLTFPSKRLLWDPLPLMRIDRISDVPEDLPECTLIVVAGGPGPKRGEVLNFTRSALSQASSVRPIYTTYEISAYHVRGLPRGAMLSLAQREPGRASKDQTQPIIGDWAAEQAWSVEELASLMQPPGEVVSLGLGGIGARLGSSHTTVSLPLDASIHPSFAAVVFGARVAGLLGPLDAGFRASDVPPWRDEIKNGAFVIAGLVPGSRLRPSLSIELPPEAVAPAISSSRGVTPGVYLTWGGYVPIDPERLRRQGFEGLFIDIGALGDEIFIRSGFHVREGMPPAQNRWTKSEFELDVPVEEGTAYQTVVLLGNLPAATADRRVRLNLLDGQTGEPSIAPIMVVIENSDFRFHEMELPGPIPPGVQRLKFEVDTWVPKEHGVGEDPRRLGFYLDGVGLK